MQALDEPHLGFEAPENRWTNLLRPQLVELVRLCDRRQHLEQA